MTALTTMAQGARRLQYDNMPADGVVGEAAFVPVDGSTVISAPDGGCGTPRCGCFRGTLFNVFFRAMH